MYTAIFSSQENKDSPFLNFAGRKLVPETEAPSVQDAGSGLGHAKWRCVRLSIIIVAIQRELPRTPSVLFHTNCYIKHYRIRELLFLNQEEGHPCFLIL